MQSRVTMFDISLKQTLKKNTPFFCVIGLFSGIKIGSQYCPVTRECEVSSFRKLIFGVTLKVPIEMLHPPNYVLPCTPQKWHQTRWICRRRQREEKSVGGFSSIKIRIFQRYLYAYKPQHTERNYIILWRELLAMFLREVRCSLENKGWNISELSSYSTAVSVRVMYVSMEKFL